MGQSSKPPEAANKLKPSLKPRHIVMVSLGGTLGAGLFIGIAEPLAHVGPLGTMLAYAMAGLVMLATMMCLGELSTSFPHAGSFQYYAYKFFPNKQLSYVIGWMYWLSWVFALAAGLIAGGIISNELCPDIPVWGWCAGYLLLLTLLNCLSARAFGECEYWLAFIKVFAIIFFIICGCYLIYLKMHGGWQPELRVHGSYFPNGWTAVIECMAVVIYSFQGAEVVGNIASEAKNPSEVLPKVIRGIGVRIVLFYILSVGVLAILEPEGYTAEASGPFVSVFKELGIPGTDTFMKLVILSATLSAANSGIYVCSRMLWSMGNAGMAPKCFSKLSGKRVPTRAILLCSALSLVCIFTRSIDAQRLFVFLIASTAQVGCAAWIVIAACQLKYRSLIEEGLYEPVKGAYRTPLNPFTGWFVIVVNTLIIAGGWFGPDGLHMFLSELVLLIILLVNYRYFYAGKKNG